MLFCSTEYASYASIISGDIIDGGIIARLGSRERDAVDREIRAVRTVVIRMRDAALIRNDACIRGTRRSCRKSLSRCCVIVSLSNGLFAELCLARVTNDAFVANESLHRDSYIITPYVLTTLKASGAKTNARESDGEPENFVRHASNYFRRRSRHIPRRLSAHSRIITIFMFIYIVSPCVFTDDSTSNDSPITPRFSR